MSKSKREWTAVIEAMEQEERAKSRREEHAKREAERTRQDEAQRTRLAEDNPAEDTTASSDASETTGGKNNSRNKVLAVSAVVIALASSSLIAAKTVMQKETGPNIAVSILPGQKSIQTKPKPVESNPKPVSRTHPKPEKKSSEPRRLIRAPLPFDRPRAEAQPAAPIAEQPSAEKPVAKSNPTVENNDSVGKEYQKTTPVDSSTGGASRTGNTSGNNSQLSVENQSIAPAASVEGGADYRDAATSAAAGRGSGGAVPEPSNK